MRLRAQRAFSITHKVKRLCDLVRLRNCAQNQRFSDLFLFQDQHFYSHHNLHNLHKQVTNTEKYLRFLTAAEFAAPVSVLPEAIHLRMSLSLSFCWSLSLSLCRPCKRYSRTFPTESAPVSVLPEMTHCNVFRESPTARQAEMGGGGHGRVFAAKRGW